MQWNDIKKIEQVFEWMMGRTAPMNVLTTMTVLEQVEQEFAQQGLDLSKMVRNIARTENDGTIQLLEDAPTAPEYCVVLIECEGRTQGVAFAVTPNEDRIVGFGRLDETTKLEDVTRH